MAICLEKIGFKTFVDSCIWGNAQDLLKEIDNEYCGHSNGKSYSYEARNFSTANVYMILNTTLHRMIEKAELFIFLGTENSTSLSQNIERQESIVSPWIFSELKFVNQVHRYDKRYFLRKDMKVKTEAFTESAIVMNSAKFLYPKPTLDFVLPNDYFQEWLLEREPLMSFKLYINDYYSECKSHIRKLENLYNLMEKKVLNENFMQINNFKR